MKKDYMPVTEGESALSESMFVEEHWTRVWNGQSASDYVTETVEARDESKIMNRYLSGLPPNSRILDGGCGLGEWTLYYTSKGFHVVGLDISQTTIQKLRARFPHHSFVAGDIRHTDFESDSFDAYFSWGAFEHFEEGLGAPLMEARRILKAGGYLFITVPFQNGRHSWRDKRELSLWDQYFHKEKGYQSRMRFYQWRLTKPELQRELEINGFRTVEIEPVHKRFGLDRTIRCDLHLDSHSRVGKVTQALLYPIIPRNFVAHMIIGVGKKV